MYVIDQNEDCARKKLHNTLARINTWCQANELSIEPSKCTAINFTRCRDPGAPVKMLGVEIPWSSPVRILGIWFSRSLCFSPHFNTVKVKSFKKINYLKSIASRSRGVSSTHMLFIINSIIRSSLEYGAPLFFDSPPSALQILEVCYNASICLAIGLPR